MATLIRDLHDRALAHAGLLVFAVSVVSLGSALTAQYVFDLQPCILCIYQRWPYVVTGLIGLAVLALVRSPGQRTALLALAGIVFAIGGGIAFFHVGVEHHWWQGTPSCGAGVDTPNSVDALRSQLLAKPVTRCDEPAWDLFGVTMAGWNLLASAGFAAASLYAALRLARARPTE